ATSSSSARIRPTNIPSRKISLRTRVPRPLATTPKPAVSLSPATKMAPCRSSSTTRNSAQAVPGGLACPGHPKKPRVLESVKKTGAQEKREESEAPPFSRSGTTKKDSCRSYCPEVLAADGVLAVFGVDK